MNKHSSFHIRFFTFSLLLFYLISLPLLADAEEFVLIWPIEGSIITDFKSVYAHPETGQEQTHWGIDIGAEPGIPVKAAADGIISFAGYTPAGGSDSSVKNTVSIEHPNGLKTTYLQLCEACVGQGQNVARGQIIAKVAASGDRSSVLPHLHFGLKQGSVYLDPKAYLRTSAGGKGDESPRSDIPENPSPVEQNPTLLPAPEQAPAYSLPEPSNAECLVDQPARSQEAVSSLPSNISALTPASQSTKRLDEKGQLAAVLSLSRSQAELPVWKGYQSLSAAEETDLKSFRDNAGRGLFRYPSAGFITVAVSAAVLLALIQSFFPVLFSSKSSLTEAGYLSLIRSLWKGG